MGEISSDASPDMAAEPDLNGDDHSEAFPHLEDPPIVEVACGLMFDPLPALDAFEFGIYWDTRREEYPQKLLQPALFDGMNVNLDGLPPVRAWLIEESDGELLQQIQHDRFYLNWRHRKGDYPHFSDHDGGDGIRTIALREFERFSTFCSSRPTISSRPAVNRVELAKIDTFNRGEHWSTLDELADLLPVTSVFTAIRQSERIQISLSEREQLSDGWLSVQINSRVDPVGNLLSVRLEARISRSVKNQSSAARILAEENTSLNRVFFELIPKAVDYFRRKERVK